MKALSILLYSGSLLLNLSSHAGDQGIVIEERPLSPATVAQPVPATIGATTAAAENGSDASAGAGDDAAMENFKQMQALQDELRTLRGRLEEQQNTIDQLREQLKAQFLNMDQRLTAVTDRMSQQATTLSSLTSGQAATAGATATKADANAPQNGDTTGKNPATADNATPIVNIEEEKNSYLSAYDVFRKQGADKAIPKMLAFLHQYPNSTFVPHAAYWLGEFYLVEKTPDPVSAKKYFEIVVQNYPEHAKASAAFYKLAMMLDMQNKPAEAKLKLQDLLKRYPNSPEAPMAQAWLDEQQKHAAKEDKAPAKAKNGNGKPSTLNSKDQKFINKVKASLDNLDEGSDDHSKKANKP